MIHFAVQAAEQAGRIIRDHLSRPHVRVDHKGEVDLVTEADLACEEAIREYLARNTPGIPILAEEQGGDRASTCWLVDPLDGTTNFVHRHPPFGVSIALQQDGELHVACIHDAPTATTFTAVRGKGAYQGRDRLQVSDRDHLHTCLLGSGFPYDRRENADRYLAYVKAFLVRSQGFRRLGAAAMDLVNVARGRLDGFWELGLQPWDMAAGTLVIREAGGEVTHLLGGPLDLFSGGILATNGRIHAQMLEVIREVDAGTS